MMDPFVDHIYSVDPAGLLSGLCGSAPLLLLWLGGIVLCLVRFRRSRLFYLLIGTALAIQLGSAIVLPFLLEPVLNSLAASEFFDPYESDPFQSGGALLVMHLVFSVPQFVSWALVLWAVFGTAGPRAVPGSDYGDDLPGR
jgi:hypothetical protein